MTASARRACCTLAARLRAAGPTRLLRTAFLAAAIVLLAVRPWLRTAPTPAPPSLPLSSLAAAAATTQVAAGSAAGPDVLHHAEHVHRTDEHWHEHSGLGAAPNRAPHVPEQQQQSVPERTIVMWTSVFGRRSGWPVGSFAHCRGVARRCRMSWRRDDAESADALVFHLRDLRSRASLPPFARRAEQFWVAFNLEPPHLVNCGLPPRALDGLFNLTWSYRRDSDVFHPYGLPPGLGLEPLVDYRFGRLRGAAPAGKYMMWLASNCDTYRKSVVQQLMQLGVGIDSYGACLHNADALRIAPPNGSAPVETLRPGSRADFDDGRTRAARLRLRAQYPFYFAFENAQCRDYVTEKYWEALEAGTIPVVRGGKFYDDFAPIPNRTFIRASDFSSVAELAAYLLRVANDDALLASYFAWRTLPISAYQPSYRRMGLEQQIGLCRLCERLHSGKPGIVRDWSTWWNGARDCAGDT